MKILLAGNELHPLHRELEAGLYTVDAVSGAADAAAGSTYDCLVLGEDCCSDVNDYISSLRAEGVSVPVLCMLHAGDAAARMAALNAGADDCMTLPCDMREAAVRVRALLRRREAYIPEKLHFGNMQLDSARSTLVCGDNSAALTRLEYMILRLLFEHPGVSFPAEEMLSRIWPENSPADVNTVWVYISRLRRKMDAIGAKAMIHSRRNLGYALMEME